MRTASVSRERQRGRNLLVVAQVAMALVLLISAVLMIRTFHAMRNVDPGFSDPASLQVMRISIPETLVRDPQTVTRIQNSIQDKLAAIPGVSSAGFAASVPMSGAEPNWDEILIEGKNYEGEKPPLRLFNYVSPGYFHTAGTRFVAGHDFTWSDIYGLRPVGILSESLARELWGSPSAAIGKRFREFSSMPWHEVVGVVQDVRENGVNQSSPATVYWPSMMRDLYGPGPLNARRTVYFALRSSRAGTQTFINEMQQAVWSVNSNLPVAAISTMQDIYSQSMARTSFTLVMLAIAGTMALCSRHPRHLRSDLVCGLAAHARDRHTDGAGREQERAAVDVRSLSVGACRGWHGCWPWRGSRTHAPHANAVVWHQSARSGHVHSRAGCPGRCSGTRKLSAGASHCCCRSRRSASSRVIRQGDPGHAVSVD